MTEPAHIHPNAVIGKNNQFGAGVIIHANVRIGDNNKIGAYTTIGTPGECLDNNEEINGHVIIGDHNVIREYVSIQSPVREKLTKIGNGCYIMNKTHIAHDCELGDFVIMAPFACLGGVVKVSDRANLGMGAIIHPRKKIGKLCMVGAGCVVIKDVPDYRKVVGVPAKDIGWNMRGMEKSMSNDEILAVTNPRAHINPIC